MKEQNSSKELQISLHKTRFKIQKTQLEIEDSLQKNNKQNTGAKDTPLAPSK